MEKRGTVDKVKVSSGQNACSGRTEAKEKMGIIKEGLSDGLC